MLSVKYIQIFLFGFCLLTPTASHAEEKIVRTTNPPSADKRFTKFDAAVRANRGAFPDNGNYGCASVKQIRRGAVSIGSIHTHGGVTGPISNQTEIHNSTIIIQTK